MGFLGRWSEQIYAILRIVVGFLFACHGAQKLFGWLGGQQVSEPLMILAGVIEFVGGIMVLLGFFASIAAFISSGEMAVAYFMAHQPQGTLPINNGGESAVLFCFIFLYIAARGSGIWSIDHARRRR